MNRLFRHSNLRTTNLASLARVAILSSLAAACSSAGPSTDEASQATAQPLGGAAPIAVTCHHVEKDYLLQGGANFTPLGFTDDDHFFYQDGATLYVTSLEPSATRSRVADIPNGNTAFIYTSGKVAFIWTNPNYASPSFGVSPLVVWTAAHGARDASAASPVGTLTTVASLDGERVVFPTNADAAGTTGDIVEASADLSSVRTLAAGVQTDYTNGPCRPLSTYLGHGRHATPAIAYCAGADTTSTLSTFVGGTRRDLPGLTDPPRLAVNPARSALIVERISSDKATRGTPLLVTADAVTAIEDVQAGYSTFLGNAAAMYVDVAADNTIGMRRASLREGGAHAVQAIPTIATILVGGFGSDSFALPNTSNDGRWFAFGTTVNPSTGTSDVAIVDVQAQNPASSVVVVEAATDFGATAAREPFTGDSRFVLYGKPNLTTGTTQLYAADIRTRATRAISDPNGYLELPANGSLVTLNDNVVPNAAGTAYVGDIKVVDVAARSITPITIAKGANITFFLDQRKRRVVYVTDAAQPGVHVAPVSGF